MKKANVPQMKEHAEQIIRRLPATVKMRVDVYCRILQVIASVDYTVSPKEKKGQIYYYKEKTIQRVRKSTYICRGEEEAVLGAYFRKRICRAIKAYMEAQVKKMTPAHRRRWNEELKLYHEIFDQAWPENKEIASDGSALDSREELIAYETARAAGLAPQLHTTSFFPQGTTNTDFIWREGHFLQLWEHMGMLLDERYCAKQRIKLQIYRENGYTVERKNLVLTYPYITREEVGGQIRCSTHIRVPEILWTLVKTGHVSARTVRKLIK